ncbi:hypothetical protein LPJ78_005648 [Coemansia sp. RSA 989]|nr:hypothetical protein BX667DRAFT_501291 [Coemansia mojavensis]KAJ1746866.1 hypothetical protein LPJ79_005639 [Coemansia sp. RSA 1821]KAJ1860876.1 hypothetical protein LPJ78_005648 [Coemansia sp. RSA 989]KAJ1868648.1 hypothetical protein LPJ55_005853 [Coemansia sp. RSA 990]KAJ2628486.1 hypothetical protein H4R22_003859 [Coemansia sp. RSA 1290]KAJ2647490.1 hypothetical protein IWW40_004626 [Coemansia sp. RSA 1250]KAJ2668415.1 hypothetical protein IWW42_005196 [Coemansia sp. RSA 1085]
MKFVALFALAAVAAAQDSSSSLDAFQQCIQDKCDGDLTNVNCQAACNGNPNPNASMIAAATECIGKCNGLDHDAAIQCVTNCNNSIYNPSGVVVSDHLSAASFTDQPAPTTASSSGSASSDSSEAGSDASDASEAESNASDNSDASEGESDASESESDASEDDSSEDTTSGASFKASLSAVALAAAAALF